MSGGQKPVQFIKGGGEWKIPNPHEKFFLTDVRPFNSEFVFSSTLWRIKDLLLFFKDLFMYFSFGCTGSSLLCLRLVSGCGDRGYSSLACEAFSPRGSSCCGAQALGCAGFSSWAHMLGSCSFQAQWLWLEDSTGPAQHFWLPGSRTQAQ